MSAVHLAYLVFGATLAVALVVFIGYAYSRKRRERIEQPKYRMLDDDE